MALEADVVRWAAVVDEAVRLEGHRFTRWSGLFDLEQLSAVTLCVIHKESRGNHDLWAGTRAETPAGSAYGLTQTKLFYAEPFEAQHNSDGAISAAGSPLEHMRYYMRELAVYLGPARGELGTAIFSRASGQPQVRVWVEEGRFARPWVPAHLEYVRTLFTGLYPRYAGWWRAWVARGKPALPQTVSRMGGSRTERRKTFTVTPALWTVRLATPGALEGLARVEDAPYDGVHVWQTQARRYDSRESAALVAVDGAPAESAQDLLAGRTSLLAVQESRRTRRDLTRRREQEKGAQRKTDVAQQRERVDWRRAYAQVAQRPAVAYTGPQYDYDTGEWI
jgi:hypothetical protein